MAPSSVGRVFFHSFASVKVPNSTLRFEELLNTTPSGQKIAVPLLKLVSTTRTDALAWLKQRGWHAQDLNQVVDQTENHTNIYLQLVTGLVDSAGRHPDQVIRRFVQPPRRSGEPPFVEALTAVAAGGDVPTHLTSGASFPPSAFFSGDSLLRHGPPNTVYQWTNLVGAEEVSSSNDAAFELLSTLLAFGHWYLAVAVAAHDNSSGPQDVATTTLAYNSFLTAAGIFEYLIDAQAALRFQTPAGCTDLLPATLRAWSLTAVAHAEELALDWALRQPSFVEDAPLCMSRLATDIMRKLREAMELLGQIAASNPHANHEARLEHPDWTDDQCARVAKWRTYLSFKGTAYEAIAIYFAGAALNHVKRGAVVLRTVGRTGQAHNATRRAIELLEGALRGAHDYVSTLELSESMGAGRDKGAPASHLRALLDVPRLAASKVPPPPPGEEPDRIPDLPVPLQIAWPTTFGLPPLHPLWSNPTASETDSGNWAAFQSYRQKHAARQLPIIEEVPAPGGQSASFDRPSPERASARFKPPAAPNADGTLRDNIHGITYIPLPGRYGGMMSTQSSWAAAPKEKRGAGFGPKVIAPPRGIPLEAGAARPISSRFSRVGTSDAGDLRSPSQGAATPNSNRSFSPTPSGRSTPPPAMFAPSPASVPAGRRGIPAGPWHPPDRNAVIPTKEQLAKWTPPIYDASGRRSSARANDLVIDPKTGDYTSVVAISPETQAFTRFDLTPEAAAAASKQRGTGGLPPRPAPGRSILSCFGERDGDSDGEHDYYAAHDPRPDPPCSLM